MLQQLALNFYYYKTIPPPHFAKIIQFFLEFEPINALEYPVQSADLNPNEHATKEGYA